MCTSSAPVQSFSDSLDQTTIYTLISYSLILSFTLSILLHDKQHQTITQPHLSITTSPSYHSMPTPTPLTKSTSPSFAHQPIMPRRDWFVVKVCHEGLIEEFKFMSNGRFPFYSDINSRVCPPICTPIRLTIQVRRQWNISQDIPIYWDQVLFFPSVESRHKIMMKRFVCNAREYVFPPATPLSQRNDADASGTKKVRNLSFNSRTTMPQSVSVLF